MLHFELLLCNFIARYDLTKMELDAEKEFFYMNCSIYD
jgi:hypothetical protein